MGEYIDREAAIDAITDLAGKAPTRSAYEAVWKSARALKKIPAADVAPVVRGKWIYHDDGVVTCSECGNAESSDSYCCRYCGAKMDGGADND